MARAVFAEGRFAGRSVVFDGMEPKEPGSIETDVSSPEEGKYIGTWESVLVLVPVKSE